MLMLIVMMMMLMLMFLMLMLMCLFQTVDMDEGNANSNINSIVGDVLKSKESCESNNIALFNSLILIESCIIAFGTRFSFCPPFWNDFIGTGTFKFIYLKNLHWNNVLIVARKKMVPVINQWQVCRQYIDIPHILVSNMMIWAFNMYLRLVWSGSLSSARAAGRRMRMRTPRYTSNLCCHPYSLRRDICRFIALGPGRPSAGGPRMDRRVVTSLGVVKVSRLALRLRRSAQRGQGGLKEL